MLQLTMGRCRINVYYWLCCSLFVHTRLVHKARLLSCTGSLLVGCRKYCLCAFDSARCMQKQACNRAAKGGAMRFDADRHWRRPLSQSETLIDNK